MHATRPRDYALSRRAFIAAACAGAGTALRAPRAPAKPARKPNVLVIMTDDQGWGDMGAYGAQDLETPHMDAIAASGVRFTQFYSGAPVCSPSRAALLSGRYPIDVGVPNNVGQHGMRGGTITMAEMFKAAGYRTAHIGKWHLGWAEDEKPNAQGFDHSFGFLGGCIDNYSQFGHWGGPSRHDLFKNGKEVFHDGKFFPDLLVDEALAYFKRERERPAFMYFAINMPHYPYQGTEAWLRRYAERGAKYPRNLYAAFLSTLDDCLGRLLTGIDALGLRDDTIIVFQSDNGPSVEERAHFGGGSAGPYRGAKFSLFEGGIRMPAMIQWPGHIATGETRDQIAHACDWMPTLADLCGVKPLGAPCDGKSLLNILNKKSAPTPHDTLHWQVGTDATAQWAVRKGDWKLIGNPGDPTLPKGATPLEPLFLANLADDPGERTNFAKAHAERVNELRTLHDIWRNAIHL